MGCRIIGNMIVCSRGVRAVPCETPGCHRPHNKLCDYPLSGPKQGKTCDRKMCERCAVPVGPNRDYCRAHEKMSRGENP